MGQDIYDLILGDNNGVPSLPLFIGNYLLDLLSSFFPIFIIMASFVMVYTAFIRGMGDWKQTAVAISPTMISIVVILGMLSMKTPSKNEGEFWKDTNSYTVVEMMTTFLGFGGMFADALTHKIIYGNLDVKEGVKPDFDGYFPNALQAMAENNKKKNEDTNKLLKDAVNLDDFKSQIEPIEQEIAGDLRILLMNLESLNIVPNVHRLDGLEAKKRDYIGYDYNTEKSVLFIPTNGKVNNNINGGISNNDVSKNIFSFNTKDILDSFNEATYLDSFADTRLLSYTGSTKSINYLSPNTQTEMIRNLISPNSFDLEVSISNIVRKFVALKVTEYNYYDLKIKEAKEIDKNTNAGRKAYFNDYISNLEAKRNLSKEILNSAAKLDKDMGAILNNVYGIKYFNPYISDLNKIFGSNFFENIKHMEYLGEEMEKKISATYKVLTSTIMPKRIFNNDNTQEQERVFHNYLNNVIKDKAVIANDLLNQVYTLVKVDAIARPKEFHRRSVFVLSTMGNQAIAKIEKSDIEREKIMKNYVDTVTGDVDVSKSLQKTIDEKYSNLGSDVIYWYDLGKFYGVFKNLYSPVITNVVAIGEINKVDNQRTDELIEFLTDQETENKNDRIMNASLIAGGAELVKTGFKLTPVGKAVTGDKSNPASTLFGGIFDAIKTVGVGIFGVYFLNTIFPAAIWMFTMITYYIEMAVYVAVFPIAFMFMIFQSYRQSLVQYMNILIGLILYPIVLVSLYFIVLYVDLLIPMFMKHFLPFFSGYDEFKQSFTMVFGGNTTSKIAGSVAGAAMEVLGSLIYTVINFMLSTLLILTWLRAHEYMSKILNVSILGQDSFNGRETMNKFGNLETFKTTNIARV